MKVVVAADSFKGSLSAAQACSAIAAGVRLACPDAEILVRPMADGGEGTLEALASAWQVEPVEVAALDAIGRVSSGFYAIRPDGLAVVELASASGLPKVSDLDLRPRDADTFGTGEVLRAALAAGAGEVLLCVGGSASTDGGSGILRALGARILDASGKEVPPGGAGLAMASALDLSGLLPEALSARWRIAVDVTNPLVGARGAAAVYGPQKGAVPEDVEFLDQALTRWTALLAEGCARDQVVSYPVDPEDLATFPGGGAAGGVPVALRAVFGAGVEPGAKLVAEAVGLHTAARHADLVLTGEGRFDAQSAQGKVVAGVVAAAGQVPVIVLAGEVSVRYEEYRAQGVRAAHSIAPGPRSLDVLRSQGEELLTQLAAAVASGTIR